MATHLKLDRIPNARPLDEWPFVSALLLGTQTRLIKGKHTVHRVIECGEGEPLFLLHGIGGHAETYARNWHNLGKSFHVYAIDARFHGLSSKDGWTDDAWLDGMVDGLADLIQSLGYAKAHVAGESLGAEVVLHFAIRYPKLVDKLIINTGGFVRTRKTDFKPAPAGGPKMLALSRQTVLDPTLATMRERMNWLVAKPERMTDEMTQIRLALYLRPEVRESMKRVYGIDKAEPGPAPGMFRYADDDLKNIKAKTLVLWTEHNPGQGPDYGEYLAEQIPGGVFYNIADAGHWPQWEKPEEHDAVLLKFLRS
jgi:2-hydroxy-6-oxonona-2,4-dienedioate hydrolase/2-hydroxy-6-oxo-6-(2'-carboxyphenyl)-hexa-2,4-dienoate hydrolase